MTLTIHKLSTRCRSPKGFERFRGVAEDAARGALASELQAQLGPSLDQLPPVVRLNELRVRVKVPARDLNTFTLSNAWARAFTLALHQALARPPDDDVSHRYESEVAYKAALLRHIARNGSSSSWEFPELSRWSGHASPRAALDFLLSQPQSIGEILTELLRSSSLDTVLALFDEPAVEKIMFALTLDAETTEALALQMLVELGDAAAASGGLLAKWPLSSRRQAIRLWVRTGRRFAIQALWDGLRLLQKLLEMPSLLTSPDRKLVPDPIPFPAWCEALLIQASRSPQDNGTHLSRKASSSLLSVLEVLRPHVPSAASPAAMRSASSQWIVSDSAGILLMLPIAKRLDLWRLARTPEFISFGGVRALSYFLAGLGMTLLGQSSEMESVEPAVALFAGILEQPDLYGMNQFFSSANVNAIHDFVEARNWTEALDAGATTMARTFASMVRGFRAASRESVVRQFIRKRGRILLEESRVLVVMEPSPWAVALRLSGMDDRLPAVEWLGYRSVEFVLEGL